MPTFANSQDLQQELSSILTADPCTLFAGAGVSAFAGLRTWREYLLALADVLAKYEDDLAAVMKKRIDRNMFLEAAHSYMESTDMPIGEKLNQLVAQLKTKQYDPLRLVPLVSLPFEAIVTTNYDRSLIEAWAHHYRAAPICVERNDPTFKSAPFYEHPFVARIHGREEVPEDIVLESRQYGDLERDPVYQDFLHQLLMRRRCLFVGFSFLDPAINNILQFIKTRGVFPKQHIAVVPANAADLIARLAAANISVRLYDPKSNHSLLWEAIMQIDQRKVSAAVQTTPPRLSDFETAKRLLAICYTRARLGKDVIALRSLVVQGIIISLVADGHSTFEGLRQHLREFIAVSDAECDVLVNEASADLRAKHLCESNGKVITLTSKPPDSRDMQPIKILTAGVLDRLMVRERFEPSSDLSAKLVPIVEEVIVLRGWDLGAEFAGAHPDEEVSPVPTVLSAIERHAGSTPTDKKQHICDALIDLMRRPSPKEEKALGELGRLSFGIELVLQAGRSTMYGTSFPETIFLDASVLMPAIAIGHPYRQAYWHAINTVKEKVGTTSEVLVSDVFLEEIYSHRNNAAKVVEELKLDKLDNLKAFIGYFSPTNTNVFIGAYSTFVANSTSPPAFREFLDSTAPFRNEAELVDFLKKEGIGTAWTKSRSSSATKRYADIRSALLEAYDVIEEESDSSRRKRDVLKQHEATQLALLEESLEAGRRAVFVTADNKLRRAVRASGRLRHLLDSLISHRGLVQLVDLLVGLKIDPSSLRRLLWSVHIADDKTVLKSYLLDRALDHYDAALLYRMGDLLDEFVYKYSHQAALEEVKLTYVDAREQATTQRFLDRIQDDFLAYLAAEFKKYKGSS